MINERRRSSKKAFGTQNSTSIYDVVHDRGVHKMHRVGTFTARSHNSTGFANIGGHGGHDRQSGGVAQLREVNASKVE